MSAPPLILSRLPRASSQERSVEASARFSLGELSGRLVELRGSTLTCAFGLVLEAQAEGEPAAYVCGQGSSFFPPDAAQSGVDLGALVVVRAGDAASRARAAAELARSGAFALVLIDLSDDPSRVPPALLSRLLGLSQKHHTALIFLAADARDDAPSALGSLISLRAVVRFILPAPASPNAGAPRSQATGGSNLDGGPRQALPDGGKGWQALSWRVRLEAVKDKRRAPGWTQEETCLAPAGMR